MQMEFWTELSQDHPSLSVLDKAGTEYERCVKGAERGFQTVLQLDHLPDGQHTLEARAVHVSAGPDASPSTVTWVLRSPPPTVQFVRGPALSTDAPFSSATFLVQTLSAAAGRTTTLLYRLLVWPIHSNLSLGFE